MVEFGPSREGDLSSDAQNVLNHYSFKIFASALIVINYWFKPLDSKVESLPYRQVSLLTILMKHIITKYRLFKIVAFIYYICFQVRLLY